MACSRHIFNKLLLSGGSSGSGPVLNLRQQVRWRYVKPEIVPAKLLKPTEPVSGSVDLGRDMTKSRKFLWDASSLNARGFLRFQKEYNPPKDARERVLSIARSSISTLAKAGDQVGSFKLDDSRVKFDFLSKVFEDFEHSIPNSMLYMINTINDVINFYCTPIKTVTPYDELVRQKSTLPPNLHIQKEPVRFHPETDTKFGGVSAYTKSSTIVTGLRSKKKYKGHEAKKSWP